MERAPRRVKDKDTDRIFDFIFNNAFGNPIIFNSTPTKSTMKANTWGKLASENTAIYIRFADGTAMKILGSNLA